MKQFKDTNGTFIIPLKENDKIFWIMQVKIQRWASGSKKNIFGTGKISATSFTKETIRDVVNEKPLHEWYFLNLVCTSKSYENQGGSEQRWAEWLPLIDSRMLKDDSWCVELQFCVATDQENLG